MNSPIKKILVFISVISAFSAFSAFSREIIFFEAPGQKTITSNSSPGMLTNAHESWFGYKIIDSTLNGIHFKIVFPEKANKNRDWIWRARFWGHEPQTDLALLKKGFHLAYIDVAGLFGGPEALRIWDEFYAFVTKKYKLNKKVVLEGMSRGGLPIFNWGNQNPEKTACIYGDAPVCDFKSWPGGKGVGKGSQSDWEKCLKQYGLTEEEALEYKNNPVDHMENIAKYQVRVLNVVGGADESVPVSENTAILEKRIKELGWEMKVIHKPGVGHHPHSLKDPKPIVDFILMSTGNVNKQIPAEPQWSMNNITIRNNFRNCKIQFEKQKKGHVAFIGGSITEMDGYRPMIYNYLSEKFPETEFTFTNAGISSTCSTTGAFRFERDVLSKGQVDLLFVEFAVNDDQDAGYSYYEAQLGMEGIIRKAFQHNPNINIIMTYFVNPGILQDYRNGKVLASIAAHDEIAQHYNISTCNLAKEVADQITVGTLDWETYGGVHPNDYGNAICAGMISSMLEKAWSEKYPFPIPDPVNVFNYENGKLVDPENCKFDEKWTYAVPGWKNIEGNKRSRFLNTEMLSTTCAGAELIFEFEGTAVGAFLLAGPDAGIIEVSIDGDEYKEFDLYHRFSNTLHYPRTIMFFNGLTPGAHSLKIRMLKKTSGKGNAMRIMDFVVN